MKKAKIQETIYNVKIERLDLHCNHNYDTGALNLSVNSEKCIVDYVCMHPECKNVYSCKAQHDINYAHLQTHKSFIFPIDKILHEFVFLGIRLVNYYLLNLENEIVNNGFNVDKLHNLFLYQSMIIELNFSFGVDGIALNKKLA